MFLALDIVRWAIPCEAESEVAVTGHHRNLRRTASLPTYLPTYLPIYGSGFIQIWVNDPYRVAGWVVVRMWNGAA
eukprot:3946052-Prymnesium_polylepis.1